MASQYSEGPTPLRIQSAGQPYGEHVKTGDAGPVGAGKETVLSPWWRKTMESVFEGAVKSVQI
jgi:hypothetical protein